MGRLHVLPPDTVTRVSEYMPEIVAFVQRIVENGLAYEGAGSVWFDVNKFEGAEGDGFRHEYAKLQPGSKGNRKLLDEGEGLLYDCKLIHELTLKAHLQGCKGNDSRPILPCGKPKANQGNLLGHRRGVTEDRDGISSAQSWLLPFWAKEWTFTAVA